jgi:hypothetical protein
MREVPVDVFNMDKYVAVWIFLQSLLLPGPRTHSIDESPDVRHERNADELLDD